MESSCKFVVVLRLLTLLVLCGSISGDVNSGSIYSLLSHVIFEMKANFEKVEKRMEIVEERLARVETTMSTVAKTSDIRIIGPNHEKELDEVTNSQALAIRKTLFAEKKILREAMHSFAQNFSDFKSEILTEMSAFSKAFNMDISTINASLESKADHMINRLDSRSMTLANEVIELTSSLNSTTSKISHVLEEARSNIEGVEQRITAVENEQKIDGGWNAWAAWTSCTATCNSGLKTRQRQCVKPRPSGGGQYCDGAPIEVVECNQNPCPRAKSSFTAKHATRLSTGILSFSTVLLNESSNFDGGSGTFTCQRSGLYFFTVLVNEGGDGINSVDCYIRLNDSDQVRLRYFNAEDSTYKQTTNGYGVVTGSATFHLTNGDRVNVWCGSNTSDVFLSSFTGFLIAEDP